MNPAFRKAVADAFRPMREAWIKAANAKGVDGKAAIAYMQEQVAKLEKK